MKCPRLDELPPPPTGKTGWPWTEECPSLEEHTPEGSVWPRITLITPSFNRKEYIEECLRSVLLQGYPNVQSVVIDGGSTDDTVSVLTKYGRWIDTWVSEPDRGPGHAINKGFALADGDIVGFAFSDDLLLPGALAHIGKSYTRTRGTIQAASTIHRFEENGVELVVTHRNLTLGTLLGSCSGGIAFSTPGLFFPATVLRQIGGFDEALPYGDDLDFVCRAVLTARVTYIEQAVAMFRVHPGSRSSGSSDATTRLMLGFTKVAKRYRRHLDRADYINWRKRSVELFVGMGVHCLRQTEFHGVRLLLWAIRSDPIWTVRSMLYCLRRG